MLLRASRASFAGLRVTESGSVAGSGAQPLLDNDNDNDYDNVFVNVTVLLIKNRIFGSVCEIAFLIF